MPIKMSSLIPNFLKKKKEKTLPFNQNEISLVKGWVKQQSHSYIGFDVLENKTLLNFTYDSMIPEYKDEYYIRKVELEDGKFTYKSDVFRDPMSGSKPWNIGTFKYGRLIDGEKGNGKVLHALLSNHFKNGKLSITTQI